MTRQEFVSAWRHEVEGWLLDAAMTNRTGAELSVFLRAMRQKIEAKLAAVYDALVPDKPIPAPLGPLSPNGPPQRKAEVKR